MPEKKCAKCGREFTCGAEARGCWCETLTLDEATLRLLKEKYADCLCKECLKGFEHPKTDF